MNAASLHLAVVHLSPAFCMLSATLILAERKFSSEGLYKTALTFGLLAAASVSAAYYSGPEADGVLKSITTMDATTQSLVENHALWGRGAFMLLLLIGGLSLQGLMQYLQGEKPPLWHRWLMLSAHLGMLPLLAWISHLGGFIRHTEIRGGLF